MRAALCRVILLEEDAIMDDLRVGHELSIAVDRSSPVALGFEPGETIGSGEGCASRRPITPARMSWQS